MTYRADMAPFTGLGDFVPALRREPRNFHFRAIASTATLAYGRASDWGRRAPPLQPVFQDYSSSRASENCSARSGAPGTSLAKARRRSSSRAAKSAAAPDARLSPFFDGAVGGGNTFSDDLGQLATHRGRGMVALCRRSVDYLWARFTVFTVLTFLALRGLTLAALDCLNALVFLIFWRLARYTAGFLAAAWTMPVTPQLNARPSANVRSRILVLLRTCGEPPIHL